MSDRIIYQNIKLVYLKRLYVNVGLVMFSLSFGIIGFYVLEDYTWIDSIYMTIITLSTVGYGEVEKLSDHGKIFVSIFIVINIGIFAYALSTIASFIVDGEFIDFFRNYRNLKRVNMLQNHVIVCGYGRNGTQVCLELEKEGCPFVIIEQNEKVIRQLQEMKIPCIEGNATDESILIQARLDTAQAIITTLPEDADNIFVVLTARYLRKDILIISRASQENAEVKLKRAGADNVIMPEKIGGAQMASLVVKPDILEFIAHLSGQDSSFGLEEIAVENIHNKFHYQPIKDINLRKHTGAYIIAIRTERGEYIINPTPNTLLQKGKKVILLGNKQELKEAKYFLLGNV